jgi:hypothetical protein
VTDVVPSSEAESLLVDLAATLEVPSSRYEAVERSYKSLCSWLERPDSCLAAHPVDVYVQGSFRLGTVIRPFDREEDYDLDVVCQFAISKATRPQISLYSDLGQEIVAYARHHGMSAPDPWRRCWTLNYADGAQFHMDVLPSVPDGQRQRQIREAARMAQDFVDQSISITDSQHHNYRRISDDWPASNPNGYADWFHGRMRIVFDMRRRALALAESRADVAEIPAFRVKTPLQSAIQILKRHRDIRFAEDSTGKPASIIITTLAAHAYRQETTIGGALLSILARMDAFIETRGEIAWIANPSDPRENFADFWADDPDLKAGFDDWLESARADFRRAATLTTAADFVDVLAPRVGRELLEAAAARRTAAPVARPANGMSRTMRRLLDAPHRRPPTWPVAQIGTVAIVGATMERSGFRTAAFTSDGPALPRNAKLTFQAATSIDPPYTVYWQVVNTGQAAVDARQLRGGFDRVETNPGLLSRTENTLYAGAHSIECFIVKNGYCVARSGPFVVNIQ